MMKPRNIQWATAAWFLFCILAILGLYFLSTYSYLLFHTLIELFSIAVAAAIFMITWNTRAFMDNSSLLFIGIAYVFVGGIDLLHTLAYKGMGVFPNYDANLATQLWIAARYLESLTLLIAPYFYHRTLRASHVFAVYTLVSALVLITTFGGWFPDCYVEGSGLTAFKKVSEYVIGVILLAATAHLHRSQEPFERDVLRWLTYALLTTIAAELAFTFYISVYGFSNLVGHIFKLISFMFIYKALIEGGLRRPYNLLFRELAQSKEVLQQEKSLLESTIESLPYPFYVIDTQDYTILLANSAATHFGDLPSEATCYTHIRKQAQPCQDTGQECLLEQVRCTKAPVQATFSQGEPDGALRYFEIHAYPIFDKAGNVVKMIEYFVDITERKQAEARLQHYAERLETLHEIDRDILAAQSPETIAAAALKRIRKLLPIQRASVVAIEGAPHEARILAVDVEGKTQLNPDQAIPFSGLEGLKDGKAVILDLASTPKPSGVERALVDEGMRSVANIPLIIQGTLVGSLNLAAAQSGAFTPEKLEAATEVADSLAVALQHARLYEQTRLDALTKAALLKEVNHRVGNTLTAITGLLHTERRYAPQDVPEETAIAVKTMLERLTQRVQGLAGAHRLLSKSEWSPLPLHELTRQIIAVALSALSAHQSIDVTIKPSVEACADGKAGPDTAACILIPPRQANNLALVINELATNTVKYAMTGRTHGQITVQATIDDARVVQFTYRDDGPGYPEDVLEGQRYDVGLRLVERFVQIGLQGTMTLTNDQGAVTILRFPVDEDT